MSDRFNKVRHGDWVLFCDICGQKCFASEAFKLSEFTGRGGLIVCRKDKDKIDYGLIPYTVSLEKTIPYTRINHTNVANGAPVIDADTSTELGV
jgi:hypothetical protein